MKYKKLLAIAAGLLVCVGGEVWGAEKFYEIPVVVQPKETAGYDVFFKLKTDLSQYLGHDQDIYLEAQEAKTEPENNIFTIQRKSGHNPGNYYYTQMDNVAKKIDLNEITVDHGTLSTWIKTEKIKPSPLGKLYDVRPDLIFYIAPEITDDLFKKNNDKTILQSIRDAAIDTFKKKFEKVDEKAGDVGTGEPEEEKMVSFVIFKIDQEGNLGILVGPEPHNVIPSLRIFESDDIKTLKLLNTTTLEDTKSISNLEKYLSKFINQKEKYDLKINEVGNYLTPASTYIFIQGATNSFRLPQTGFKMRPDFHWEEIASKDELNKIDFSGLKTEAAKYITMMQEIISKAKKSKKTDESDTTAETDLNNLVRALYNLAQ